MCSNWNVRFILRSSLVAGSKLELVLICNTIWRIIFDINIVPNGNSPSQTNAKVYSHNWRFIWNNWTLFDQCLQWLALWIPFTCFWADICENASTRVVFRTRQSLVNNFVVLFSSGKLTKITLCIVSVHGTPHFLQCEPIANYLPRMPLALWRRNSDEIAAVSLHDLNECSTHRSSFDWSSWSWWSRDMCQHRSVDTVCICYRRFVCP